MIAFRNYGIGRYHLRKQLESGKSLCGVLVIPYKFGMPKWEFAIPSEEMEKVLSEEREAEEGGKTLCTLCTGEKKLIPSPCLPISDTTASFLTQLLIEAQEEARAETQAQRKEQGQGSFLIHRFPKGDK